MFTIGFHVSSFFLLQGRSGLLLVPIRAHFRHGAGLSGAGSSISGIPPKCIRSSLQGCETWHINICRNSSGIVPVRVRKTVVQVRITPTIIRAIVQVAERQNGKPQCHESLYLFEIVIYKLHFIIVKIFRGVPLWSATIHPHYDASLRPHLPVAERRAAKIQCEPERPSARYA